MGFRNPLTSLSGSQITPGTITGSTLQTAATGKRVVISAALSGRGDFYSGDARESRPGTIQSGVQGIGSTNDVGYLKVSAPIIDASGADEAVLTLSGKSPSSLVGAQIDLTAFNATVSTTNFSTQAVLQLSNEQWNVATLNPAVPWATYAAGLEASYRKDAAGRVSLRGLVAGGYFGTLIFTLPPGYRPAMWTITTALISIDGVEKSIRVDIFPDGQVKCGNSSGTAISYLSLAQLDFWAG